MRYRRDGSESMQAEADDLDGLLELFDEASGARRELREAERVCEDSSRPGMPALSHDYDSAEWAAERYASAKARLSDALGELVKGMVREAYHDATAPV